jgi:multiple sugar transport system permease protein
MSFVLPVVLFLIVFAAGPFLFTLVLSMFRWNMLVPFTEAEFIGWDNYRFLANSGLFRTAFTNTVVFAVAAVMLSLALALIVALALNSPVHFRGVWRTLYFLPYVTSMVAVSLVWVNVYNARYGLINGILDLFGLPPQPFLASVDQALPSIIGVAVWYTVGYFMVIFLAGLQAIPETLHEAAAIDGASYLQRLRYVTLPLLKPTMLFVLVVNTIISLQVFDFVFVMTGGGPVDATQTVLLSIYETGFRDLRMGRASAMAVLLFLAICVLVAIQVRWLRERDS